MMFHLVKSNGEYVPAPRDPAILDGLDLTEEERSVLIDNINRRLTPQAVKIRAGNNILWKGNMFFFSVGLDVTHSHNSSSSFSLSHLQTSRWHATDMRALMQ